jgi:hypothetical protein
MPMEDDLKVLMKDLKSKIRKNRNLVKPKELDKIDIKKQKKDFFEFLQNYDNELKKNADSSMYVSNLIDDFSKMKLVDIRFVIEKSNDKYNKMCYLIQKYEDNFSEEEIKKYTDRSKVLNDILAYMVINSVGEYFDAEEDEAY